MKKISDRYYHDNNSLIDRELSSIYKNIHIAKNPHIKIANLVYKFLTTRQPPTIKHQPTTKRHPLPSINHHTINHQPAIKYQPQPTVKHQPEIQLNSYFDNIEKFPNYQLFNEKTKTNNGFITINNIILNIIYTFNPEISMFRDDVLDKLIKYVHEQMAYKFRSIYENANYSIIKRIGDKYALENALLTDKSPHKHPLYEIFVCDYFRLNIAIFDIETKKWGWYGRNTKEYKVLPIAKHKRTLYRTGNKVILNYSDFDIIQYKLEDLNKMKLPALQNIGRDLGIKLQKMGVHKMINRTKKELIEDICN